jgi:hypothetical protein
MKLLGKHVPIPVVLAALALDLAVTYIALALVLNVY